MLKKYNILGIDNLNSYYSVKLKKIEYKILKHYKKFSFKKVDISNYNRVLLLFNEIQAWYFNNLAAQAGVRYSLIDPGAYAKANLIGFFNILDSCRTHKISHLIFRTHSSVYGANKKMPFKEKNIADHPIQFYAATKRSNEIMAHSYSVL